MNHREACQKLVETSGICLQIPCAECPFLGPEEALIFPDCNRVRSELIHLTNKPDAGLVRAAQKWLDEHPTYTIQDLFLDVPHPAIPESKRSEMRDNVCGQLGTKVAQRTADRLPPPILEILTLGILLSDILAGHWPFNYRAFPVIGAFWDEILREVKLP